MSQAANEFPHFVQYPEGNVFHRNLSKKYPVISHGEGIYLFDRDGKRYIDAVGGAMVASVGHGNAEVIAEICEGMKKVSYVNGMQFTSEPTEKLAAILAEKGTSIGLDRSSFFCSGSEAVEAAVKLCRQLQYERGNEKKFKLIARTPSYHGNTLYALSASGRLHYKKVFGPLLHEVITVDAPYGYRFSHGDYEKEGADYFATQLEAVIKKEGAETVSAMILEPIVGSSAGGALPPQGYFERVSEICRKNGILLIADEIMVGVGRTGQYFACDHYGFKPDVLLLGKGVAGGYAPLSVLMTKTSIVDEFKNGSGNFMHAQTYMQAPAMTLAGLAVHHYFEKNKTLENVADLGDYFHSQLRERILSLSSVGNVSGKGLIAGVEFVKDKKTKTPFPRAEKFVEKLVLKAQGKGLILWSNVGHADGVNGDLVMLGPPLNISRSEIDEIVDTLADAIG